MGRRGPLPDPTSERSAIGRNTITKAKPAESSTVTCPRHVGARPIAAAFWKAHAPALVEAGRLRRVSAQVFGELCHLFADVRELTDQVGREGWTIATDKGQAISPIARLLRDSRRDFVNLAGRFGLTAADDARIPSDEATDAEETDPLAEFGVGEE